MSENQLPDPAPSKDVVVPVVGVETATSVGHLGLVADSTTAAGSEVQRLSTSGAVSSSKADVDGSVHLTLHGTVDTGRRGEERVVGVLKEALTPLPCVVIDEGRPVEDRGGDWRLRIDGRVLEVQVTTVVPEDRFFEPRSADDPVHVKADVRIAAGWTWDAVERKSKKYPLPDRSARLLALDVHHLSALIRSELPRVFDEMYGARTTAAGFAEVWLIGPTAEACVRIDRHDGHN